jgi:peptidyl-prolyl cis-trans isomerase C
MSSYRLAMAAALAVIVGCAQPPEPADAVARVGDEVLTAEGFHRYLDRTLGDEARDLPSPVLSALFDQFLDEELLVHLAHDQGLLPEEAGTRRLAVDRLLRQEAPAPPDEAEVERWYREHLDQMRRPERVRLRQILVEDRETAEQALAEIRAGRDFAEVARDYSRDPSAERGGYQGELSREEVPPSLVETIFELRPGDVSEVVEAEYGYHVFEVLERSPAEVVPFEEAREEISEQLRRAASDRLLEDLVERARKRYAVEVYARNLPFNYQGSYREEDA